MFAVPAASRPVTVGHVVGSVMVALVVLTTVSMQVLAIFEP
jgi:hypothetical protein